MANISPYLKFMNENHLSDGLLRELVQKEKWRAARSCCVTAIIRRENEIESLKKLMDKVDAENQKLVDAGRELQ